MFKIDENTKRLLLEKIWNEIESFKKNNEIMYPNTYNHIFKNIFLN